MEEWRQLAQERIAALKATPEGRRKYAEARKRARWWYRQEFPDTVIGEIEGWQRLPYCLVAHGGGFVFLDRDYLLIGSQRHLNEWTEADGLVRFARDPRTVVGLCPLVVDRTGWLYLGQTCSAAEYKEKLDTLWALRMGCEGRA